MLKYTLLASCILTPLIQASDSHTPWKDQYFKMFPQADLNKDGKLSWEEYHQSQAAESSRHLLVEQEIPQQQARASSKNVKSSISKSLLQNLRKNNRNSK